jgi:hypothetical protein
MEDVKFKSLLTLLILSKVERFRNAYDLCKVLAWKFKIIECHELSSFLAREKLTNEVLINAIHHYTVTAEGQGYLDTNEEWLKAELVTRYPGEQEFIQNVLLSNVSK